MGLGAYPAADPQWLGMLGMHGTWEANNVMHDCDLMVAIGARFDDRITGRVNAFSPGSKKIQIDIDPSSINKNVRVDLPIIGDVAEVLEDMLVVWKAEKPRIDQAALKAWWQQIEHWRARDCLAYRQNRRRHHAAIRHRAALCGDQATRTSTSPPRSASTRCGRPSSSTSRSRTAG